MSVDFFSIDCTEKPKTESIFGICDDQNASKAYTDVTNETIWIATVVNQRGTHITFIAIDHCLSIKKEGTDDNESTCDGMLIFRDGLYLVELKNQGTGGWLPKAKSQLENTIRLLQEYHVLDQFRHKKAFACNKRHPYFTVFDVEEKKAFFKKTNGFRLDAQAKIVI
ncbi:MAG: hypothetical protein JNJ90_05260 [Saprospiraceae bacterium]|jgi:hypothetical protein|nr:hypothetical protein [Saprospiraceae bacterium]